MISRLFVSRTISLLLVMKSRSYWKLTLSVSWATTKRCREFGIVLPWRLKIFFTLVARFLMTKLWIKILLMRNRDNKFKASSLNASKLSEFELINTNRGKILWDKDLCEPENCLLFVESLCLHYWVNYIEQLL